MLAPMAEQLCYGLATLFASAMKDLEDHIAT